MFAVSGGGFRQFRYETFNATADFRENGDQSRRHASAERHQLDHGKGLRPDGAVPRRHLLRSHGVTRSGRPHRPPRRKHSDRPGVVQGFTTALTNVTGIARASIDIGGSAGDPHPTGVINIENGAFRVCTNWCDLHRRGAVGSTCCPIGCISTKSRSSTTVSTSSQSVAISRSMSSMSGTSI